ncbi:MAG: hypothetical protein SV377_04270 [Halobacteria archaeon]|nr:hypothetical protein [Halobacteria archaeon]
MSIELTVASVFSGLNALLLLTLAYVWLSNYRKFKTLETLGLAVFALVMLTENVIAIYYSFSMSMLYSSDPNVQTAVMVLRGLQFVALIFLTWVTVR